MPQYKHVRLESRRIKTCILLSIAVRIQR